jgi:hypothetical protein
MSFEENTQELVKGFIKDILKIEEDVPLQVAHRLRKRKDGCPRSIIACPWLVVLSRYSGFFHY